MAVNKVMFGDTPVIDISDSTVTRENLLFGAVAYNASGEKIEGKLVVIYDNEPATIVTEIVESEGVKTITETSEDHVMVTTFSEVQGVKTITSVITPETGDYKYLNTTVIEKIENGTRITEQYRKETKS